MMIETEYCALCHWAIERGFFFGVWRHVRGVPKRPNVYPYRHWAVKAAGSGQASE